MRHFCGSPVARQIAGLLFGCVILAPLAAEAGSTSGDRLRTIAGADAGADPELLLPAVPTAAVVINPQDLMPGEGVHAALSRFVRHPGSILDGTTPAGLRHASVSAPAVDDREPMKPPARPSLPARAQPVDAPPAPPAMATPAEAPAPASGGGAVLDAAALKQALRDYVEADAKCAAGPLPARAEARRDARQAIAAFYAGRADAPLWVEGGQFGARARSVLARIDHAAEDGLDLSKAPVLVPHGEDVASLAAAEISLSEAAVAYGRQATGSRIPDPGHISPLIAAKPDIADAPHILASLAAANDAGDALRDFNPPQPGYGLLRERLAQLRQRSETAGHGPIPYGPILKPGMTDARVPLIRARFGLDLPNGEAETSGLVYDTRVAAAVADFQRSHGLPASGVLTIRTVGALSFGDPVRLEHEILANMERWRWLPRDLGTNHIDVNIPDFSLNVVEDGTVVHHARVVVGKPDKQTPMFSEDMKFIIVNPYWNVPLSIVQKEMMPKLAADPNYFANHGYETVQRDGITYVRQPPGDANALGRIKFMFPNRFSVYLHDTNARALFGNDMRAMSHGCVRVDQPFKLAEVVLGRNHGWTEARVKTLIGGAERTISLPQPMTVHIVYFTAFVDANGVLRLRDDVYGYSAKVKAALGLEG